MIEVKNGIDECILQELDIDESNYKICDKYYDIYDTDMNITQAMKIIMIRTFQINKFSHNWKYYDKTPMARTETNLAVPNR